MHELEIASRFSSFSHRTPCTSSSWRVPESAAILQQYYILLYEAIWQNVPLMSDEGTNDLIFLFVRAPIRVPYICTGFLPLFFRIGQLVVGHRTTSIRTQERARGRIAYRSRHD